MRDRGKSGDTERTAHVLKHVANGLSYARIIGGPLIGVYIARQPGYRSWKMASLIGLLSASDALDGKLARYAAELDPQQTDQRGAWLDQMADKIFTHTILGGMAVNAMRTQQRGLATTLAINQTVQLTRDIWVTDVRKRASEHGVATNAQTLGKIKTGALLASTIAMASPLAIAAEHDRPIGQLVSAAGITTGSVLAIASGISLAQSLEATIATSEQATCVLGDTSQERLPEIAASAPR